MMTLIFALLLAALTLAACGRARPGLICLLAALVCSGGLFLFEIYNPAYGFRMPWIQVSAPVTQGEG
jgi:hypothetical protein